MILVSLASWVQQLREVSRSFMPHGHCYLWTPSLLWLHVITDTLIGIAYLSISFTLYSLVRRTRLPFHTMFVAFGVFIGACGATHFMETWNVWNSAYWTAGGVKLVTAVASVATGLWLFPLIPRAEKLVNDASLAEERRVALEQAHAQLRERDRYRTDFFAGVSHELRTPLALVLGPAGRLLEADLPPAARAEVDLIVRNARVLLERVNELLEAARVEAGELRITLVADDLAALVGRVVSLFEGAARERSVELQVQAGEAVPALVDPPRLERVLVNLLANALRFAPEHSVVRVGLRVDAGRARLTVEDAGPGVPPEDREVIFERFRTAGPDRLSGSSGLGLAIARDLVKAHGGTLHAEDSPLGGAAFVAELPLREPDVAPVPRGPSQQTREGAAVATAPRAATPATPPELPPREGLPRVLVVEDEPDLQAFVRRSLEPAMATDGASSGEEGLARARELRPDAIVTDLMMPGIGGAGLVEGLRSDPELRDVPILVLSARHDDELRARLLREAVQDYLVKPFAAAELVARVGNLVRTRRARQVLQEELSSRTADLEQLARELARRRRELQEALQTAELARAHAEDAARTRSRFLALVSHELRTPLTSMRLLTRTLQSTSDPQQRADRVARLERQVDRLQNLIQALLDLASAQTGRLQVRVDRVVPAEIAREVVEEQEPLAREKGLRLHLEAQEGSVLTDARLLRMVIGNLVSNAVRFTAQGRVDVEIALPEGGLRLEVRDTGPGIAEDDHRRIFDPFEQLEDIRHKSTPGVGLGLALVRQGVEALGGDVELRSAPGRGSAFHVRLPAGPVSPLPGARDPG